MGKMTESKKRDFVSQLIVIMEQNAQLLTDKGFDPAEKIAALTQEMTATDTAEARQREAAAAAKDATRLAQQTLDVAYTNGSATVDLITGLLGKKDNLVLEIKKIRNTDRKPKPSPALPG
jgi:polyhydroxyalkanoate synthesis regulator phasin